MQTSRRSAPDVLPTVDAASTAEPVVEGAPEPDLLSARWDQVITQYGFTGSPPGDYDTTIILGPAVDYDQVRFHGYAASSQPLTIVVDGRDNAGAFRVLLTGISSAADVTIYGHAGNDVFGGTGFVGPHTYYGGTGDDIYNTLSGVELAGEGIDTVYVRSNDVTLAENMERLIHGYVEFIGSTPSHVLHTEYSPNATGRGNAADNYIEGFGIQYGMGGNDTLTGGALAEILIAGAGDDTLNGGGGLDTASYVDAASGVFVTLDQAQPMATNDGDGGVDTLNGIENLTGSVFNDVLIGDGVANVLTGGAGGDYLIALGGNDVLIGGAGVANTLQGGHGDDRYVVSAVGDTVLEFAGEGMDTVETALSALTLRNHVEVLRYTGAGAFTGTGSAQDNLIVGGAGNDILIGMGGDDRLEGGEGADTFRGGSANDQFIGGGGLDTADYSTAGARVVVSIANSRTSDDGDGGVDTFEGVENANGSAFNDVLIGNGGANVLSGGIGADTLAGLAGNDVLIGGGGAPNQMQGGLGDDRYVMTAAGDTLIELAGEGADTVETTVAAYVLRSHFENLTYTGAGAFTGTGNTQNNVLTGAAGADTFTGLQGDDTIYGNNGVDTVVMSGVRSDYTIQAGADYIAIGDSVVGRDGIDTLYGVERIRFSDGEILDVTPPAAAAVPDVLLAAPRLPYGPSDDVFLTVPDHERGWSDF